VVDERWRSLMRFQVDRARQFYAQSHQGISCLEADARWPVWSASMLYGQILDVIERNDYRVFSQRAYVPQWQKLATLPAAWLRAQVL
jgi:phytoene synthase